MHPEAAARGIAGGADVNVTSGDRRNSLCEITRSAGVA